MYVDIDIKQEERKAEYVDMEDIGFGERHSQIVKGEQFVENIDCYLKDLKAIDEQIARDVAGFESSNKKYLVILSFTDSNKSTPLMNSKDSSVSASSKTI